QRLDVVGVTGTNGKTTVVHVLATLARAAGRSTRTIGTLTGERTTPEAPELQRLLAEAVGAGVDLVAMEVSSHALDLHRVDGVAFRAAAFTNLGRDHLDHHGTLEAYFAAKARLFEPERCAVAVIDVDDPHGARLAAAVEVPVVATGLSTVEVLEVGPRGSRVRWRGHTLAVPLPGRFNLVDVVVAAELAVAVGIDDALVADAVTTLEPVPGRFERVDDGDGPTVLVDYAHTPDGLEAALTAARDLTERDLVVVVGAGGDRDREKRPRMGEVARALADRVVVTSDNPRSEDPAVIAAAVVSGMTRPPDLVELDRRLAIRHALAHARPGDVVVIAGKGHETTQIFADTAVDFDDRVVARAELARLRERVR
ncbi:MAG: UDP-N-acetylmuramoyl-L-alanyl-D-glutamate--2,6-diaminopimelate ligase, partial [Actinomyces sp.]